MRLIDADALMDELNDRIEAAIKWGDNAIAERNAEIKLRAEQAVATFCEASLTVKKMPTISPKRGRWIDKFGGVYRCSNCEMVFSESDVSDTPIRRWHYCPNCGARMVTE